MTETTHKAEPWSYQYSPYTAQDGNEIPAFEIHADDVKVCDTNEDRPAGEQEANARLIAAAPELLNALTCLLLYAEDIHAEDLDLEVYEQARSAIRRATGI